ncbi:GNAT family N-acetyltransferase [Prescottella subtropica]|uniref:GNAT family N-acetyltransferase n=1 Tax=Prescottella subtropica TaxID=2545757 RepID=UPI0010F9DCDB|nr:GNAT family N-acetyltransferase [Prescottella subtropica]
MGHVNPGSTRSAARPVTDDAVRVVDNPARERYELWVGDDLVGLLGYHRDTAGGVLTLLHTVIDEDHGGRGWAAVLVAAVLDRARRDDVRIRPVCTYVARYLGLHPECGDLVAG